LATCGAPFRVSQPMAGFTIIALFMLVIYLLLLFLFVVFQTEQVLPKAVGVPTIKTPDILLFFNSLN
jgi:hypothetical protein